MKLLPTSSGIKNQSIHDALVELLGKPISQASALFVPTAIHLFGEGRRRPCARSQAIPSARRCASWAGGHWGSSS